MTLTNSYWSQKGIHQGEYDRLQAKLVPSLGRAWTMHGNLLRCIGNIYYDLYNNGLCNANTDKIQGQTLFLLEFEEEIVKRLIPNGEKDELRKFVHRIQKYGRQLDEVEAKDIDEDPKFVRLLERITDAVILVVKEIDEKGDN